jgi:carbamoyltransferase
MNIVGLSFGYHDSAVSLIRDGKVLFALQEERLSRVKNDPRFPTLALNALLEFNQGEKIDGIVFYEKSFLKFDRIIHEFIDSWPFSYLEFRKAFPLWLGNKLKIKKQIYAHLKDRSIPISFCKHHESHAASAYFTSGFRESAILTLDGVGEWECGAIHHGQGSSIKTLSHRVYPDSVGLFYSAMTDFLGFEVNEGEYKVMGLAPYGTPRFEEALRQNLIEVLYDGGIQLNRKLLSYPVSERLFKTAKLESILGISKRLKAEPLEQVHFDLAASVQVILEDVVLRSARHALELTGSKNLCFAGGVALNCVANGKILKTLKAEKLLENLHFISACGDAGGSTGAALYHYHHILGNKPLEEAQLAPYWGPHFTSEQIEASLKVSGLRFHNLFDKEITKKAIELIQDDKIIAWFQGRLEFGPRALGNRSILGNAGNKENWQKINQMVKFREDFRPLAPAVLAEKAPEYFDLAEESPLMLLVSQTKTSALPATTHVDQSSRVQTVRRQDNPLFYDLIKQYGDKTGSYALINTSFNTSGMPIVCSPQDAVRCFIESDLDALFIGSYFVLRKENQWIQKI